MSSAGSRYGRAGSELVPSDLFCAGPARRRAGVRRARWLLVALVLALQLTCGCGTGYLLRVSLEEGKILWRRRPIGELLAEGKLAPGEPEKLRAVVEARRFAREALGLRVGQSFTTVSYLTPGTRIHVLSAALMDSLEPHSWWFPIVGRVPYKGFFDRARAEAARQELEREGFDTYLRTAAAFSTLGWFADPILRSALGQDEVSIVNMVLHELCHNTFSLGADRSFDESLANFVGTVGAMEFFARRDGAGSGLARRAARGWQEELAMAAFIERLRVELGRLYGSHLPRRKLAARRQEVFRRALAEVPELGLRSGEHFFDQGINNAIVIHYSLYLTGMDTFERIYKENAFSLRDTIETVRAAVKGSEDPFRSLRETR